jgi:AcrR family transcriptional regulator
LVTASLDILHKDGSAGLSLRKCADAVGVSHTAPKNHFGNMAGLLTALVSAGYAILADNMRDGWAEDTPRPKRRDLALQGYVSFAVDHPDLFELMFARERTKSDDPELMGNVVACFAVLADIAQDLPLGHASDELTARRARMFIWSAVHGYAQLCIAGRFKKDEMKRLTILDILPQMTP